jgi:hypothetical protein
MCCGQKRSELQNNQTRRTVPQYSSHNRPAEPVARPSSAAQAPEIATASTPQSLTSIRYLENSPIQVRGLASGRCYEFSGAHPVQQVDLRDASSLLNTRFFRRA